METTEKVIETMRNAGKPVSAGEVATLSGLDRCEVSPIKHTHLSNRNGIILLMIQRNPLTEKTGCVSWH
ncbi:MAG: transcriptional regulator [Bacteroidales bacterium]|nr:transcriptional regulator [Bacteroidales bacterium]